MSDLPAMLRVEGRPVVVVGGGKVAVRRVQALCRAGAVVTVIAPAIEPAIERTPAALERRTYQSGDLNGAWLVVICTADAAVNQRVADDAKAAGILINRADLPEAGDVLIPAHEHVGPLTVAVSTSGISAASAAAIRDGLLASLDPRWIELLAAIEPFRAEAQQRITNDQQRLEALKAMSNAEARRLLETGGADAVSRHCRDIMNRYAGRATDAR
jgi:siroheme synthase-like protein